MTAAASPPEWATRSERGALPLIKLIVWIALRLGRPAARLLLYPICVHYLLFAGVPRRASRAYLARVLGRTPGIADVFRHFRCFAACVLDRVFLLSDQSQLFDIAITGEDIVRDILKRRSGCILLGAHLGSFEVARTVGLRQGDLRIGLLMYEENARKIRAALSAINPRLATEVISLGRSESMIAVSERLERGDFVGMLADRGLRGEEGARYPFLDGLARFPEGPFRLAVVLQRPVVLMFGLYRGGRRYEVVFEPLIDPARPAAGDRSEQIEAAMRRYVERLEHHCRQTPFNWFNFYDFWD